LISVSITCGGGASGAVPADAGGRAAGIPKTALTEHRAPQFGEICAILPMSRDRRLVFQLAAEEKAVAGDDIGAGNRHTARTPQSAKCPIVACRQVRMPVLRASAHPFISAELHWASP